MPELEVERPLGDLDERGRDLGDRRRRGELLGNVDLLGEGTNNLGVVGDRLGDGWGEDEQKSELRALPVIVGVRRATGEDGERPPVSAALSSPPRTRPRPVAVARTDR